MSGRIIAVVGGQFGSEGKGHVAAALADSRRAGQNGAPTVVRVAGPNAGHTAYDHQGRKWAMRQIPVAAVTNLESQLVIAAGSEIDEDVLFTEITELEEAGIPISDRLHIDRSATVITEQHKIREGVEGLVGRIGSTGKGIGAARADRIMREAALWGGGSDHPINEVADPGSDTAAKLRLDLDRGVDVLIEGTQGYGLGLHTEHYPKCTSSDCRAVDFMAMAGLSPWGYEVEPWVVLRTYPIRVAGASGALEGETDWEALAEETDGYIQPERTTVTQKVRRVGEWDVDLAREAVQANGHDVKVALTFLDYWFPELAGSTNLSDLNEEMVAAIERVQDQVGAEVAMVGTGPDSRIWL